MTGWAGEPGVVELPSGVLIRGRASSPPRSSAEFSLLLVRISVPWAYRYVRWPDFWVPLSRSDAFDAFREALRRARDGQRVEVVCQGGKGRTGTALAAMAILDGLPADQAVSWVREHYDRRAVETPWQRWWVERSGDGNPSGRSRL